MDAEMWDQMYRGRERVFSGEPNGVLVTEVADLPPGRALDVGCGEGGDALWLARRGWQVTAVDVAPTALARAAAAGADVADRVTWEPVDVLSTPPPAGAFDLVSAQYFHFPRQVGDDAVRGVLAAVAPGGTLLVALHDAADVAGHQDHEGHGFDPTGYYDSADIAKLLDDEWTVLVDETRPRTAPAPPGTHHTRDTVLRARRSPASAT